MSDFRLMTTSSPQEYVWSWYLGKDPKLVSTKNQVAWNEWRQRIAGYEEDVHDALTAAVTLQKIPRDRGHPVGQFIKESDTVYSLRCQHGGRLILVKHERVYMVFAFFPATEDVQCIFTKYLLLLSKHRVTQNDAKTYMEQVAPDMLPLSVPVELIPSTVPEPSVRLTPMNTVEYIAQAPHINPQNTETQTGEEVFKSNKEVDAQYEEKFM